MGLASMNSMSFSNEYLGEDPFDFFWKVIDENLCAVSINEQGQIIYASRPFIVLTGQSPDGQLKIWDLIETINPGEGIRQLFSAGSQAGKSWERLILIRIKSGKPLKVKALFYPSNDLVHPVRHLMLFFSEYQTPIPHISKTELRKPYNWANDLLNPTNYILALCELLNQTPLGKHQGELVNKLFQSTGILLGMIDDMLQLETGNNIYMDATFIPFDLKKTIREFLLIINQRAETKEIIFTTEIDDSLPDLVYGDPQRLNQVLLYISQYLLANPGTRSVRVSALAEKSGPDSCEVSLFMHGLFLSQDNTQMQDEQPNEMLNQTFKKVRINLDKLNGKVLLQECNPKAFYCHFVVPFALKPSGATPDFAESNKVGETFPENVKILIADDVEVNQLVMKHQLLRIGAEAQFVRTGFGVLEKLQDEKFDLIIMDVQMPGLDGLQAIEAIRANKRRPYHDIPIIGISASMGQGAREKCLAAGANDFFPNPFNLQELKNKISTLITEHRNKSNVEMNQNTTEFINPETEKYFDLKYLEEISEGDKEFSSTLISYFIDNTPKVLNSLKEETQNQNWEQVRHIAHKFKPQVQYMGIHQISEVVEQVEQNAHNRESLDQIWLQVQIIEKTCQVAIKQLTAELKIMRES